ncbi:MAG: phosphoglycerate dehydrogenase [Gammaproteobacteria bacterium]|jgi:D-3-phosphoglycerate dehydrogenase / 2-oxoglutarate reductase|nr:phosphoglycerate dehydrogenase [Gammaproteobacteria bacterium]MBT4493606.1 phosphoglycerate dehydrogenase [Gammaproteobacteria bacterium]MBT7372210.1 phosphoglycerate dehydrogenase [Gammaproteobacteria bacterium]
MFKIRTLNNISETGLARLPEEHYSISGDAEDPDAILVRSHQLTLEDVSSSLRAVGRAGAGVNNIPVSDYTDRGVVVFNTPGANANAVKELVMVGLLLSCRGIIPGIDYVNSLESHTDKAELNKLVEASKKQYKGRELKGKTLGVLGLGAIGSMVADMALQMEMEVVGFDPALSVEAAWRLSSRVQRMENMQSLFSRSDIVTLHVPALDSTRGMINDETLAQFRDGAVLLNFSREEIVDKDAIIAALDSGKISQYISDFPTPGLIGKPGVVSTPHLGASTEEAEENCAVMVADQVRDFLENGNIKNSVNFPALSLERTEGCFRIALANRNVPRILGNVLSILADRNLNVVDMLNKSREDVAYNIIDIETVPSDDLVDEILNIEGVLNVRIFDEIEG